MDITPSSQSVAAEISRSEVTILEGHNSEVCFQIFYHVCKKKIV